jgi:hypothetical protein
MTNINYEAEVKKVYPNAECKSNMIGYYININVGNFYSNPTFAWQSAYETLKQQNKL